MQRFLSRWNLDYGMLGWLQVTRNDSYLWNLALCLAKLFLEERTMSQQSHGIDIPSKWLASMWFFIWCGRPSLPHTLQIHDVAFLIVPFGRFPSGIIFWPLTINDFNFSSTSCRFVPVDGFGIDDAFKVRSKSVVYGITWLFGLMDSVGNSLPLIISDYFGWSNLSPKSQEVCPVRPFSWISLAITRKESKSSW